MPGAAAPPDAVRKPPARAMAAVMAALLLAGCAQTGSRHGDAAPTAAAPAVALDADHRFSADADAPQPSAADLRWWRRFDDPAMVSWVERALEANAEIAIAGEQTAQARALLRSARAQRGVRIGAQADATLRLQPDAGARRLQPGAGLTLDVDTDLWGGLRQAEQSAAAGLLRSQDLLQAARLSIAGLAARAYLEWRVAAQDAALLTDVLQLQREVLRVATIRVEAGLAPVLDRDRATAEMAATEAERAAAAVRERQSLAALQVLAGESPLPSAQTPRGPQGTTAGALSGIPALQGLQPVARPLDLLRLRPDLRAAEQALVGAAADVGVAEAALRPRLRLPGRLVFGAATGGGLLELVTATLAAALDVTLFDGGALQADVDAARARARSAAQVYRQTVLLALQQVESALAAQQGATLRVAARERAADAARAAERQAQSLYRAGLVGSLDLIDAQRTAIANRRAWLQARGEAAAAAVLAFETMGLIDDAQDRAIGDLRSDTR
ncbi:efflux transporter outer membrane subunit [Comamonadaceae bacterium G21597-S1]|nr:efflux transporter outer membrane subunit [Comamonadaceae bacterium G21597-S1]